MPVLSDDFAKICAQYKRVAIAGGPRCGKSTLSVTVTDRPVIGTDDYKGIPWEVIPERMIADVIGKDTFVIEGVMVARALRRGLIVDAVVYMTLPKVKQLPGQVAMTKGVLTIFKQWRTQNMGIPLFIE